MSRRVLGAQFTRESLREDVRLGQHAQQLRAESQGLGYKEETAGFYGSDKVAQADHSERRLTIADADREHAARRAADADEEARHVPMTAEELEEHHRHMEASGW